MAEERELTHVVALSGGHDSTAMALRLADVEPRSYTYLITPTGDELPPMQEHWARLADLLGTPLTPVGNLTLSGLIEHYGALPNWRQRWCTRQLKIEPCLAWLKAHGPAILYVGLRADEEERRGIYSEGIVQRFPLREWGWGEREVQEYLRRRNVRVPARTDCARCYGQRLGEWRALWERYPAVYAAAEREEAATGHTFRSAGRDRMPAALAPLRREFEQNPRLPIWEEEEEETTRFSSCRVCRL